MILIFHFINISSFKFNEQIWVVSAKESDDLEARTKATNKATE